jgi:hypothetical protein
MKSLHERFDRDGFDVQSFSSVNNQEPSVMRCRAGKGGSAMAVLEFIGEMTDDLDVEHEVEFKVPTPKGQFKSDIRFDSITEADFRPRPTQRGRNRGPVESRQATNG